MIRDQISAPMLLFRVALQCDIYHYEDQPEELTQNIYAMLTEDGLQNYGYHAYDLALKYLTKIEIPDIQVSVAGFSVSLKDMTLSDFMYPGIQISYQEDGSMGLTFDNISLTFTLTFAVQQTTYPYIGDWGDGEIRMLNFRVTGILEQTDWNGCPYSPQIAIRYA